MSNFLQQEICSYCCC